MNQRIRLEFDIDDPSYLPPNLMDGALRTPQAFRGGGLYIEVALFHGHTPTKTLVPDTELAGFVSLGVAAKDRGNLDGPYALNPVTASLTTGLTLDSWNSGTGFHAAFTLTGAATNIDVLILQLVLFGVDSSNNFAPLGITNLDLKKSGLGGDQLPVVADRTRITAPLQLHWPDGNWYTILPIMGDDGKPTLAISETPEN